MNESSTIDDKKVELSDVADQIDKLLKSQPQLLKLLNEVEYDNDSLKWLQRMPILAKLCNKKFGTELTEFDLMRNALIFNKKERIKEVISFAKNQGIQLEKKDAQSLYKLGSEAELPSKDIFTNETEVIRLLQHAGFITSEAIPQKLKAFLDAIENDDGFKRYFFYFIDKNPKLFAALSVSMGLISSTKFTSMLYDPPLKDMQRLAMAIGALPVILLYFRVIENKNGYKNAQSDVASYIKRNTKEELDCILNKHSTK